MALLLVITVMNTKIKTPESQIMSTIAINKLRHGFQNTDIVTKSIEMASLLLTIMAQTNAGSISFYLLKYNILTMVVVRAA